MQLRRAGWTRGGRAGRVLSLGQESYSRCRPTKQQTKQNKKQLEPYGAPKMAAETRRSRSSESFLISLRGACPWNDATLSELLHQRSLAGSRAVHTAPCRALLRNVRGRRFAAAADWRRLSLESSSVPRSKPRAPPPRTLGARHAQGSLRGLGCVGSHPQR